MAGLPRPGTRTSILSRTAARDRPLARLRWREDEEGDAAAQVEEHRAASEHQQNHQSIGHHLRLGREAHERLGGVLSSACGRREAHGSCASAASCKHWGARSEASGCARVRPEGVPCRPSGCTTIRPPAGYRLGHEARTPELRSSHPQNPPARRVGVQHANSEAICDNVTEGKNSFWAVFRLKPILRSPTPEFDTGPQTRVQ